jgi:hypothetical protein
MGIDTVINFPCIPKDVLTTEGILERLKLRNRAEAILQLYRDQGDLRPTDEIGFEVTRRGSDGSTDTQTVIVSEALDQAKELSEVAPHCVGCPANRTNQPFGCITTINFPISENGEIWLLRQLPQSGSPLVHFLQRGINEYGYDGETARPLRKQEEVYFESDEALGRPYVDQNLIVTTDMLFEMMFMVGPIQPGHAAMLLLFFNIIPRDNLTADDIFWLVNGNTISSDADQTASELPLLLKFDPDEDHSIKDFKHTLHALHIAYTLNVSLLVDV